MMIFIFLSVAFTGIAQDSSFVKPLTKADYLEKSKKLKTTSIVLFCVGGGLIIGGSALIVNNLDDIFSSDGGNAAVGTVLFFAGLAGIVGGIVSAVKSHKNKVKAFSMTAGIQPVYLSPKNTVYSRSIPTLSITFKLPNQHRH